MRKNNTSETIHEHSVFIFIDDIFMVALIVAIAAYSLCVHPRYDQWNKRSKRKHRLYH